MHSIAWKLTPSQMDHNIRNEMVLGMVLKIPWPGKVVSIQTTDGEKDFNFRYQLKCMRNYFKMHTGAIRV